MFLRALVLLFFVTGDARGDNIDTVCNSIIYKYNCDHFTRKQLCGSDGRLYNTECDFAKAHCRQRHLSIVSEGSACKQTGSTTGGNANFNIVCDQIIANYDCSRFTQKVLCGNDGKVYNSECEFSKAHCKNQHLSIVSEGGPCASNLSTTAGLLMSTPNPSTTPYPLTSTTVGNPNFQAVCDQIVSKYDCSSFTQKVLCGSDGQVYNSECEFSKAHCKNQHLSIVSEGGPCAQTTVANPSTTMGIAVSTPYPNPSTTMGIAVSTPYPNPSTTMGIAASTPYSNPSTTMGIAVSTPYPNPSTTMAILMSTLYPNPSSTLGIAMSTPYPNPPTTAGILMSTQYPNPSTTMGVLVSTPYPNPSTTMGIEISTPYPNPSTTTGIVMSTPYPNPSTTMGIEVSKPFINPSTTNGMMMSTPYPNPSTTIGITVSTPYPIPSTSTGILVSTPYPNPSTTIGIAVSTPYPNPSTTMGNIMSTLYPNPSTTGGVAVSTPYPNPSTTVGILVSTPYPNPSTTLGVAVSTPQVNTMTTLTEKSPYIQSNQPTYIPTAPDTRPTLTVTMETQTVTSGTVTTRLTPVYTLDPILCSVLLTAKCPQDGGKVCGSDSKTYDNVCELEKQKCLTPEVTQKSDGKCQSSFAILCRPILDQPCPAESEPVCGSDGIQYNNSCEHQKAKCVDPTLTVAHPGPC